MELKSRKNIKRRIIIIISTIFMTILIVVITAFLYIHSFINKMNLVNASETATAEITHTLSLEEDSDLATETESEAESEAEKINSDLPDAPEPEVAVLEDKIKANMEKNQVEIKYDKNVFNVLLIGSDTRTNGGAGRSDAMILVSINKDTKKIIVTSILRDIYLKIPGMAKSNRINTAYAFGGADLLLNTIEQNFKIKVDKYASIDFYAFIDIVDTVGGVTLQVNEEDIPIINDYVKELNNLTKQEEEKDCLTESGILLLNGKQALGYARNRYVGTDFERTARQRRVLEQVYTEMKSLNLLELQDMLNAILPQVTTNLTEGEIFSMILSFATYINYDIEQWSIPMAGSYEGMRIRGMEVLGIDFDQNINELQSKVYGDE